MGARDAPAVIGSAPTPAYAELAADGPDEMGRELAAGPQAVEATLAGMRAGLPELRHVLVEAERVVLIGTGASLALARAVEPPWRAAGGPTVLVRESSAIVFGGTDGYELRSDDVVVAVSKSGHSPETLAAAARARDVGASLIAVTADRASPLAAGADTTVWTPIGEERGAATKSELAAAAALCALGGLLSADPGDVGSLGRRLGDLVADWSWPAGRGPRLAAAPHLWILGSGSARGVSEAAALLWHEKVHRPAVATTPTEFRHGPVEATGAADALVLIESLDVGPVETGYLESLLREIGLLGAVSIRVAPPADGEAERVLGTLLRVQQLARATAHAAGTYRDGFGVLGVVVKPATLDAP